ncbi:MAG: hypothetical protein P1U57_04860 [Oleibacter sp.]|nr:hypothetical protein [Thalassolituus sp.]
MTLHRTRLVLLITLLSVIVSACGWRLRGLTPLPESIQRIYLDAGAYSDMAKIIAQQLEFNGAQVVASLEQANIALIVDEYRIERRNATIGSNGRVAEYELNGFLAVFIENQNAEDPNSDNDSGLLDRQRLEMSTRRVYTNDINNVLATEREEETLRKDIKNDLASRLLRQLQRLPNQRQANKLETQP